LDNSNAGPFVERLAGRRAPRRFF